MYETLHSDRIVSNPIMGVTFVAQLLGGELKIYARLANGINNGHVVNHFELREDEWDTQKCPYMVNPSALYIAAHKDCAFTAWINQTVAPWQRQVKIAWIQKSIDVTLRETAQMQDELQRLTQNA